MRKKVLIISIISLILTFIFTEIFSLYHFGDIPTLLTSFYLITIFSIFNYILLTIVYIVSKIKNKKKISTKKIIGLILLFISLITIFIYGIVLEIDYLNWYAYSSPFYINVIYRSIEFLLPSILFIIISIVLLRKK